jgi:hypothetical protein
MACFRLTGPRFSSRGIEIVGTGFDESRLGWLCRWVAKALLTATPTLAPDGTFWTLFTRKHDKHDRSRVDRRLLANLFLALTLESCPKPSKLSRAVAWRVTYPVCCPLLPKLLTTEVMIADAPKDEAEHAHMPAGGGMGNNGHVSDTAYLFIDRYERPR